MAALDVPSCLRTETLRLAAISGVQHAAVRFDVALYK